MATRGMLVGKARTLFSGSISAEVCGARDFIVYCVMYLTVTVYNFLFSSPGGTQGMRGMELHVRCLQIYNPWL